MDVVGGCRGRRRCLLDVAGVVRGCCGHVRAPMGVVGPAMAPRTCEEAIGGRRGCCVGVRASWALDRAWTWLGIVGVRGRRCRRCRRSVGNGRGWSTCSYGCVPKRQRKSSSGWMLWFDITGSLEVPGVQEPRRLRVHERRSATPVRRDKETRMGCGWRSDAFAVSHVHAAVEKGMGSSCRVETLSVRPSSAVRRSPFAFTARCTGKFPVLI